MTRKITNSFFYRMFWIILLSVLLMEIVSAVYSIQSFSRESSRIRAQLMQTHKNRIRMEAENTVHYLTLMRKQLYEQITRETQSRLEKHCCYLSCYPDQYAEYISQLKSLQSVVDCVSGKKQASTSGLFYINKQNDISWIKYSGKLSGHTLEDIFGVHGSRVRNEMNTLSKDKISSSLFLNVMDQETTIICIRKIPALELIFCSCVSMDEYERVLQQATLKEIEKRVFGKEGYVFIGQWDGVSLIPISKQKNMLDVQDAKGKYVVRSLIRAARNGGGYVSYEMPAIKGVKQQSKISYSISFDPWEWYVGAGMYPHEVERYIHARSKLLKNNLWNSLFYSFLVALFVLLIALIVGVYFTRKLRGEFNSFEQFFAHIVSDNSDDRKPSIQFHYQEFNLLASYANRMLEKREIVRQEYLRFKSIADYSDFGVVEIGEDNLICYVNRYFSKCHGLTESQLLGKSYESLHTSKQLEQVHKILHTVRDKMKVGPLIVWHKHVDGTVFPMLTTAYVRYGLNGKNPSVIATTIDFSGQYHLENQLRQAQKMEAVGQLAGGIAHDFNNLLVPVLGYSELLMSQLEDAKELQEEVGEIQKAALRARTLVAKLLSFSKNQVMEMVEVDMNRGIEQMREILAHSVRDDIELVFDLDKQPVTFYGDFVQMEQIIMNLVINARDAMPQGGTIRVSTEVKELTEYQLQPYALDLPGNYCILSVSDTGCGIEEENLPHIFEPFFTTKSMEKGTGLGLATVYGIVKQFSGGVSVRSVPGKGTSFSLIFPFLASEGRKEIIDEPMLRNAFGSESILVVDDEEMVGRFVVQSLSLYGYQVRLISDPLQCLNMFQQEPDFQVDLLLSDMVMPDMNGFELFEKLSEIRPDLKVLFMSGYNEDIVGTSNSGFRFPFLAKPFLVKTLLGKIREVLDDVASI